MLGTLVEVKDIAAGVRSFRFEVKGLRAPEPGQYVMFAFPSDPGVSRAFSVVETQGETLLIGVKKLGVFTSRLFDAKVGDRLDVRGPFGRFVLPKVPCGLVLVAGGIGITPLLSLALAVHRSKDPWSVDVFYSAKQRDQAAFFDVLESLGDERIRVRFFFTDGTDAGFSSERVTADVLERFVPDVRQRLVYVCGPPPMMDALRSGLYQKGLGEEQVRSEVFS